MGIQIRTGSGKSLRTIGSRVLAEYKKRANAGGKEAMSELKAAAIEVLSQPGHGRAYKRGRKIHQASAPGEPPAPDTGTSRRSVIFRKDGPLRWIFGGNKILMWLQRGTRTILPRPWIFESLRRALPKMKAAIRRSLAGG